ncbi:MAG: ABC transporter substrate-binding protein [Chloroflexi bacterium]|nr:ABC transporter substrate-binding protein [Chloroflexota bacterium]
MNWERTSRKRGSRRWFLGVAGGTAGAAGLAALGCTGGTKQPSTPTAGQSATNGASSTPNATRTRAPGSQRGEALRYTGYVANDGLFDPHKTQAGPFYGQQALVFSRLLAYQSQADGSIVADLATKLPETPDAQTYLFNLNPNARWHEDSPMNGRRVTAQDVKFSIERQRDGDPSFVRKAQWQNVDSIEAPTDTQVVVKLKAPFAAMAGLFADVNGFIVAPEVTANNGAYAADRQPGSGPFKWVEWSDGKFASVARNPNWHGGNSRPFLDGVTVFQPKDANEVEAGLRTKGLDVAFVGRPQAERLKKAVPQLKEATVGQTRFFGMRFFTPTTPYDDPRVRTAMTIALDRRAMLDQFFAGSGEMNPWISWPNTRWSLPQAELANLPGYRQGAGGRNQDITDAKAMLAAYTSTKKMPDELGLLVVDDAEVTLGMGSLISKQLRETLGLNVVVRSVTIADLVGRLFQGQAPWAAGPDSGWIDLDDWVYPYFHSNGTRNSFPLRDTEMDALIDAQRVELDAARRQKIGFDIQRKLLTLNVGANFVSERVVALAWEYVKNFPLDASDGYQHRFADCWIDVNDPSFRGR